MFLINQLENLHSATIIKFTVFMCACSEATHGDLKTKSDDLELFTNVTPQSYDIELHPDLIESNFVFEGQLSMQVNVSHETLNTTLDKALDMISHSEQRRRFLDSIKKRVNLRLPRAVTPQSYNITLIPFLVENNFTFKGEVFIRVNVIEQTSNITLHAKMLNIDNTSLSVNLLSKNITSVVEIQASEYDYYKEFFIIHLKEPLEQNKSYTVNIPFEGTISDKLEGFHKIKYTENNHTKWALVTRFGPADARMAFPCFDEPDLKATFKITLARHINMSSISNMPKEGLPQPVDGVPGYVWDKYKESPPMSTYLVCWVVSEFEKISDGNFSVWARRDVLSQVKHVLKIGPRILNFYENYFHIKYPLPKMDMIGFPEFGTSSMENWGLITYRESSLLYQDGISSFSTLVHISFCVAHELAHQFFGNLVTMQWWTDLWLNEGFAQYISYLGLNEIQPEWKVLDTFVQREMHSALASDARNYTHKLKIDIVDPALEKSSIFDEITYFKEASVMRMLEHFLKDLILQKGLQLYINSKKYSNADQDDLWAALTTVANDYSVLEKNVTIKKIMDTWTLQKGYPIVTVIRNYNMNTVTFTQKLFSTEYISNESSALWWVPISYATKNKPHFDNTAPKFWLQGTRSLTVNLTAQRNEWLIINLKQTGYFVVNYDYSNWIMIIAQLQNPKNYKEIHVINRMQILYDLFAFAKIGILNYSIALNASKYLIHEENELPWSVAIKNLPSVGVNLRNTQHYNKFQKFLAHLFRTPYSKSGFNDTSNDHSYLSDEIRDIACLSGVEDCIHNCFQALLSWKNMSDPDQKIPIDPKLRKLVYCVVVKFGSTEDWEFLWQRFIHLKSTWIEERWLRQGLACSQNREILIEYLDRTFKMGRVEGYRKISDIFDIMAGNLVAEDLMFQYLKDNWSNFVDVFGNNTYLHANALQDATSNMRTEAQLKEVKEFAEKINIGEFKKEKIYENVQKNIAFIDKLNNIAEWVSELDFDNSE